MDTNTLEGKVAEAIADLKRLGSHSLLADALVGLVRARDALRDYRKVEQEAAAYCFDVDLENRRFGGAP